MEDQKVIFTIITVCFNSEKTIEDTIKSVLDQTYDKYEYIIIDGKSTDKTIEIIESYLPIFSGKLRFISEPDRGVYDAMNKGINMASGDLICLLNSDDWFEPNALEVMSKHYHREDYKIQYAMQKVITNGKVEKAVIYTHDFLSRQMIPHQTCFITKKLYKKIGAFDLKYKSGADYDFMLRAYKDPDVIFEPIYTILVNFRSGGMSSTVYGGLEQAEIKKKYGMITAKQFRYLRIKARLISVAKKLHLLQ